MDLGTSLGQWRCHGLPSATGVCTGLTRSVMPFHKRTAATRRSVGRLPKVLTKTVRSLPAEGPVLRLTVKERILLHLFEFTKFAESIDVTQAITQTGIATATRIEVQHVMQYTRPLLKEGLVRERLAHIKGSSRRRKVYDLTDSGKMAAVRLREVVKSEVVRVRDSSGTREAPIAEVLKQAGPGTALVEIVRQAMDPGVVDLTALPAAAGEAVPLVARLAGAPRISRFVGRHAGLGRLTTARGGARGVWVRGGGGVGESYLAAKAC